MAPITELSTMVSSNSSFAIALQPVDEVTRSASAELAQHLDRQAEAIAPKQKKAAPKIPAIIFKPTSDLTKAIACVLEGAAKAIRKCGVAARNRCPWVSYVNQAGGVCSQFLKRSLFQGYHFQFKNGLAVVTNLETGAQYTTSLEPQLFCTCQAFKFSPSPKPPCKHIKMVAEVLGQSLEQAIAPQPQYVGVDETDLPRGCFLQRSEDRVLAEYNVWIHCVEIFRGVPTLTKKCVGRLVEGMNGSLSAYLPRSGNPDNFTGTGDAVNFLVKRAGYRLIDVASALDAWNQR